MKPRCSLFVPLVILPLACTRRPWNDNADASEASTPSAPQTISCVTTTTCTLACDSSETPETFTTITCAKNVAPAQCTTSSDESTSYGCTLSCDHEAEVVDACSEDTTTP